MNFRVYFPYFPNGLVRVGVFGGFIGIPSQNRSKRQNVSKCGSILYAKVPHCQKLTKPGFIKNEKNTEIPSFNHKRIIFKIQSAADFSKNSVLLKLSTLSLNGSGFQRKCQFMTPFMTPMWVTPFEDYDSIKPLTGHH